MSKVLYITKWVSLKESSTGFQFLERKGKDSVAILLFKVENNELYCLIRKQPLCALLDGVKDHVLGNCPITGSIEQDENYKITAIREVEEESGYILNIDKLVDIGFYIVGTQTNEKCFIYIADVTGLKNKIPEGDGSLDESVSYNEWVKFKDIKNESYSGLAIIYLRFIQALNSPDFNLAYLKEYVKEV